MKKLMSLSAAVLISAMAFAQQDTVPGNGNIPGNNRTDTMPKRNSSSSGDGSDLSKQTLEDRVMMVQDQVVVIKKGDSTVLSDSIKLQSGAVVLKDGSVRFKNGTTTKLKNGQYINLNPAKKSKAGSKDESK